MIEDLRKAIHKFKADTGAIEIKILCGNSFYCKLLKEALQQSMFTFRFIDSFDGNVILNNPYMPEDGCFLADKRLWDYPVDNSLYIESREYPFRTLKEDEQSRWKFIVV